MKCSSRSCPVCSSSDARLIHANTMVEIDGLNMSYMLAQCNICGFHFAQELPENDQYLCYYRKLSKYDSQSLVSAVDKERVDAAVKLCESFKIPKNSFIVDLGCGFGVMLAALRRAGWERLIGLDPAPKSAEQAKNIFDLDCVRQGCLENVNEIVNLREADLVCLMAVLEHLPQLKRDLSRIIASMRPGAQIFVEVPALDLFSENDGEPFGELSLEHIQFFSEKSICNLFASLGVHVLQSKLLPLSGFGSGSLFVLAEVGWGSWPVALVHENSDAMRRYLAGSARRFELALERVPNQPFVLYGAGSHSARLVPKLSIEQRSNLVAVLDGNINLHGKYFDKWIIQSPDSLSNYPGTLVLISSYIHESGIANALRERFPKQPLQLMYSND